MANSQPFCWLRSTASSYPLPGLGAEIVAGNAGLVDTRAQQERKRQDRQRRGECHYDRIDLLHVSSQLVSSSQNRLR